MALTLADYLSADPTLLAQIQATYGNGGPTVGTMPVSGPVQRTPGAIGLMPITGPGAPRVAPGVAVPVPGNPPPLGDVAHPSYGRPGYYPDGKNLYNSPFVRDYVSPLLPQGEYQRTLNSQGLGNSSTRAGQYGLSQYADAQRQYQAAQLRNPGLTFRNFLAQGGAGDIMGRWKGLSAGARGLNPASRSSVVRWG